MTRYSGTGERRAPARRELVTNAILHTGPLNPQAPARCRLTVDRPEPDTVRVEVSDGCPRLPRRRAATDDETSGRGLCLVQAIAESWGTTPHQHGKTVWAVLRVKTH
ncbi:ATP-binding protein [Streptomyces sp. NPDC058441]|uniref:ATP-binding protein n=1 Tax=Streptomyces sp. NPDC058441 TaxID=3346502 RepID=UPI0036645169